MEKAREDQVKAEQAKAALTGAVFELVEGLSAGGIKEVVVAPGSRSTPLALALYRHPAVHLYMHYDERAAAYFALGLADAAHRPVALLCTSGTAAANFLAAVVEASLSDIPLVVLTADRPPELRDVGASQTIEQRNLYGSFVRWFYECPLPDPTLSDHGLYARIGLRAARRAASTRPGPVHLNVPFREPLGIGGRPDNVPTHRAGESGVAPMAPHRSRRDLEALALSLAGQRGVVVAGAEDLERGAPAITSLARALAWPLVADPLSNLRRPGVPVLTHYDGWLTAADWRNLHFDVQVRFGPPPVSKPLNQGLQTVPLVLIDREDHWRDPFFQTARWISVPDYGVLEPVPARIRPSSLAGAADAFQAADARAAAAMSAAIAGLPEAGSRFEGALFARLAPAVTGYQALLVGNSMPVRDLDTFARDLGPRVFGQRGASGIDGVLSHGFGISAALGRTLVVVGDLSFVHDLNGLLAAHLHQLPVTAVVVNNRGGGIFSFLNQHGDLPAEEFETLFGTPHAIDLAQAAGAFGVPYARMTDVRDVLAAVSEQAAVAGPLVVEWQVADREDNLRWHQIVKDHARRAALGKEWPDAESRIV